MQRKYCNTCFYPDNKPDIYFKEGKCSACLAFEKRKDIDWNAREQDFKRIADSLRNNSVSPYHCIVPVSGGKDSHFQVLKCLEYGLRPLAVYATTDDITPIGRQNVENIASLCDLVEVNVNTATRRRINKYTLQTIGDISWAEHITIFTIPFREAAIRGIGTIIYGENSQNEYGGPEEAQSAIHLTRRWLSEFGGLNGLRPSDLKQKGLLTNNDLQYFAVTDADGNSDIENIKAYFLGHFFDWDGYKNAEIAKKHGFKVWPGPIEGMGFNYENLDNYQTGIHDYFKYLKFGFGRATDLVNNHIRRGRMSREEGREHILEWDGNYEYAYMQESWEHILERIDMTIREFEEVVKKFVNKDLFDYSDNLGLIPKFELPK